MQPIGLSSKLLTCLSVVSGLVFIYFVIPLPYDMSSGLRMSYKSSKRQKVMAMPESEEPTTSGDVDSCRNDSLSVIRYFKHLVHQNNDSVLDENDLDSSCFMHLRTKVSSTLLIK